MPKFYSNEDVVKVITEDVKDVKKGRLGIVKWYWEKEHFIIQFWKEDDERYKPNWIVHFDDIEFLNEDDVKKYMTYQEYLNSKNT